MGSINTDSHRPVFKERQLKGLCISRCDVGVALDMSSELGCVHMAKSILFREGKRKCYNEPLEPLKGLETIHCRPVHVPPWKELIVTDLEY